MRDDKVLSNGTHDHAHEHEHNHEHEHDHEHDHDDPNAATMFQLSVRLPHKPYDITVTVSSQEQVQDLRQSIVETPDTFQYTCFHLEHNGERINDFIELSEVKDLKPDSQITLVEDPYTEKEARMHLVRMRELIGAAGDRSDLVQGICAGTSLHDDLFGPIPTTESAEDKTANGHDTLVGYEMESKPDIFTILPKDQNALPKTVKALSVSQWNPPPHHLRQRGHLLYLLLTTNEGEQHHITASISGFFVNKSSSNKFDPFPKPAPKNHSSHSLLGLISLLSPSFNSAFLELQKVNGQKDLLTTFPFQNAIPANPWIVHPSAAQSHLADTTRSQEAYLTGGSDGAENLRDWNEEFQTTRELPRESLQDRVFRERLTSKLFADYNDAAARGAVLVARGEVPPLNPTEGKDAQIFIYNNIFYSFGADGVQTFSGEGGDEAARVAVGKDVLGVKAVNQLDIPGLFTPGTVVVDYLGKRIVGQSIVPGIFKQREPGEHQIDYGGVEGRDVVTENDAFVPVFEKLSKALHVKKHAVWDKEGKRHDLEGSVETKGLLGTDGRKYVLDLYRIAPLDVAWQEQVAAEAENNKYPHRMSILRSELVEAYWRSKMQEYVKAEVEKRKAAQADPEKTDASKEDNEKAQESPEEKKDDPEHERVDISNFTLALNPDVCSGQVPQTDEEKAVYLEDEKEVRAVCDFLRSKVIPELIHDLYESDVGFPMDGIALTQLLHKRGINIRYLGLMTTLAEEKGTRIRAFVTVAIQEMIARAFKHVLNGYLRHLPSIFAPNAIAHLLNCLLGSNLNASPEAESDENESFYPDGDFSFKKVTPGGLFEQIQQQVRTRFRFDLPEQWQTSMKSLQLLREICIKNGIQLAAKEFVFTRETSTENSATNGNGVNGTPTEESKKKKNKKARARSESPPEDTRTKPQTTFVPDDILNVTPIVKDAAPRSALAEEALEAGKISLAQGQKQLGQELVLESLSLHEQIYGILHPEVAKMYHSLSTIYYQTDEKDAAVELARKAVIVTERTLGIDSHDTILAYLNLSLFEHHVGNTKRALKYVRHALDVWKVVYGPYHPDSITTMNNAAVMFQSLKEYSESRRWFESCFKVCEEFYGKQSINAATILFQLAQALALDGDAKGSVNKMRDAYNVFLNELGADDRNTKEAETWLEQLTQNAVNIAKQAQYLEKRGIRYIMPSRLRSGTRLQPQNASSAAPRVTTNNGTTTNNSNSSASNAAAAGTLDSRSIDELLKYIEGGDMASPKTSKSKRKSMNPKARGRKTAVAA